MQSINYKKYEKKITKEGIVVLKRINNLNKIKILEKSFK